MKRISFIVIGVSIVISGLVIGYFVFDITQDRPWKGLSCEEMFYFSMIPEHQDLTMEQHMDFHQSYFPCLQNMDSDGTASDNTAETSGFTKITNFEANLAQNTLFLSVTVDDNIPENANEMIFDKNAIGFGYAWLAPDKTGHVDLIGILANIHRTNSGSSNSFDYWHIEPVDIELLTGVNSELCIFANQTFGEIFVNDNSVKVILPTSDVDLSPDEFDRALSLEIVMDRGCSSGFGANILDSSLEKTS